MIDCVLASKSPLGFDGPIASSGACAGFRLGLFVRQVFLAAAHVQADAALIFLLDIKRSGGWIGLSISCCHFEASTQSITSFPTVRDMATCGGWLLFPARRGGREAGVREWG